MDHELALEPSKAVDTMMELQLITKETFDDFLVILLSWYRESAYEENEIPNIYEIFHYVEPYSTMFFEIFAKSLAWKDSNMLGEDKNSVFDYELREYYMKLLVDNYERLQPMMIYDIERTLKGLSFQYVWDNQEYGGTECMIKNPVLLEVW